MSEILPAFHRPGKFFLLAIFVFYNFINVYAQPGIEWERTYPTRLNDRFSSVVSTPDGGYVAAGEYSTFTSSGQIGRPDYRIIKISATGDVQWEKTFGGDYYDQGTRVALAQDGGYLVAGNSQSNKSGDKSENDRAKSINDRGDFWIIKLAQDGTRQWEKTIGGDKVDLLQSVCATPDGGYLLGGSSASDISGDKKSASRGTYDFWLVKIDASGRILWDKNYGSSGDDMLSDMKLTADGVILAGTSNSPAGGDKTQNALGGTDYWIVKVSPEGNKLWDKRYGGNYNDALNSMDLTADGGFVLQGSSNSGRGGNKGEISRGADDYWVVKTNASGNVQWNRTIGGKSFDFGERVVHLADGGYLLSGRSYSRPGADRVEPKKGAYSIWLVKLDAGGTKIWEKAIGALRYSDYSTSTDLIRTTDGGFMLAAQVRSSAASGDISRPTSGPDSWLVKLQAEGNTKEIQLSDSTIELYASPSDLNPGKTITVNNNITPDLIIPSNASWLTGTVAGSRIQFAANASGLSAGTYTTNVTINAAGYAGASIPVTLVVRIVPGIPSIGVITVPINQSAVFNARANVGPGEYAIFSLNGAPAGAQMDTAGRFIWTPQVPGTYVFRIKASTSRAPVLTSEREVRVVALPGNPDDVIRINAGGDDYMTADGRFFQGDKYHSGRPGISTPAPADIAGTVDDELYNIARCSEQFAYAIPVKKAIYRVTLHFAEVFWGTREGRPGPNSRSFNIYTEASERPIKYDIFSEAKGVFKAVQYTYDVAVYDEVLNLNFVATRDKARLSAIELTYLQPLQTIKLAPTDDAYVQGGTYANQNFGSAPVLDVKSGGREDLSRRSLIKFSLAGINEVNSARLRIYGYNHEPDIYPFANLDIHTLDNDSWNENMVTWNTAPQGTMEEIAVIPVFSTPEYFELNVTKYAKRWVAEDKVVTLIIRDNGGRKMRVVFNSKESGINLPELIIQSTDPVANVARLAAEPILKIPQNETSASTIFPNPVRKQLSIQLSPQHHDNISLNLINAAGRMYPLKTKEKAQGGSIAEADLSNLSLSKGIYHLKVQSDNASEVLKVLIVD